MGRAHRQCRREWFQLRGRARDRRFELRSHLVAALGAPVADQLVDGAERGSAITTSPTPSDIIRPGTQPRNLPPA